MFSLASFALRVSGHCTSDVAHDVMSKQIVRLYSRRHVMNIKDIKRV